MKEFTIQKNEENQRLDKYLKKLLPNATTSFLYKMMRKKNIVINKIDFFTGVLLSCHFCLELRCL